MAEREVKFEKASSPIDPEMLARILGELGMKKFDKSGLKCHVALRNGVVTVSGDKAVCEWATALVKSLDGK